MAPRPLFSAFVAQKRAGLARGKQPSAGKNGPSPDACLLAVPAEELVRAEPPRAGLPRAQTDATTTGPDVAGRAAPRGGPGGTAPARPISAPKSPRIAEDHRRGGVLLSCSLIEQSQRGGMKNPA
jgi:hypothetical protein